MGYGGGNFGTGQKTAESYRVREPTPSMLTGASASGSEHVASHVIKGGVTWQNSRSPHQLGLVSRWRALGISWKWKDWARSTQRSSRSRPRAKMSSCAPPATL